MAPFEKVVVVVERAFAFGVGARDVVGLLVAAAVAFVIVVSLVLATWVLVPAAESTHSFMLVIDIRVMLSLFAFA
jgi:hypothetical protein